MTKRISSQANYLDQCRASKKRSYIDIKNRIRTTAPMFGGRFTTHQLIHGENGWLDLYFLGAKSPVFYNVTLETTRCAYRAKVRRHAMALSYRLVPERAPDCIDLAQFNPVSGLYESPPAVHMQYSQFGGLTRYDWEDAQLERLANEGTIQVRENWTLHPDYAFGIGLHATIDAPYLTMANIEAFIDRFLKHPAPYRSGQPLTYSYSDIPFWGIEVNSILGT